MGRKDKKLIVAKFTVVMKTLIIVRHAKSSWDDPDISDFNRPLNERGKKDAPRMAKRLKEKDLAFNTVVSSPAVRALTTCEAFVDVLGSQRNGYRRSRSCITPVMR